MMNSPFHEWITGDLVVSDDPSRLDLDQIHEFLSRRSYWAQGIPRSTVERSVANSLCFGVYRGGCQVGFGRVITDRATFGWLADVYVMEAERGRGVGKALVAAVVSHPELAGLRRLMLATADAHGLYEAYGFRVIDQPERFMAFRRENPYNVPAGPAGSMGTGGAATQADSNP